MALANGGGWPPDFSAWQPDDWSALASWVTALIALAAGLIALSQVGEARRLRREQAQPYVVVYMEPAEADPQLIDLVIKNLGTTAAMHVRVAITPSPQRSEQHGEPPEDVWLPETLPVLVPGQEWRTFWDFSPDRKDSGLPDYHRATVRYQDSQGRKLDPIQAQLDWSTYKGRQWVTTYGIHHAAKALQGIDRTLGQWKEGPRGGLAVFVRDGDAKDEATTARRAQQIAAHEALRARVLPEKTEQDPSA